MKLIWHIAKKDLRRLRWPLVLFGALMLLQYAVWSIAEAKSGVSTSVAVAVWGMHLLMAWLLVPLFVHEDAVVGLAEWRVRPISGARLLGAKVLGIFFGLCLWPSLLTLPWWLNFGFGAGEIVHVMAVNTLGMMALTGVALLIAGLTRDFAKFIAASLIVAVTAALVALTTAADIPANGEGAVGPALAMTRAALGWGIVLATAIMVVPMQYLGRRPGWMRGLAIGAGLSAVIVALMWPSTGAQMLARTGLKRFALPTVTATLGETQLLMPSDPARRPATMRVTTKFVEHGMLGGDSIGVTKAEPTWTMGGESRPGLLIPTGDSQWWELKLADWARGSDAREERLGTSTWVQRFPGEVAPQLRGGNSLLKARNSGVLWRSERGPTVPLKAGAGASRGLRQVHVVAVTEEHFTEDYSLRRQLRWLETEPLFLPAALLELINPDGMGRHRWKPALLNKGEKEITDFTPDSDREGAGEMVGRGQLLIGVTRVAQLASDFSRRWWLEPERERSAFSFAGAHLTSLVMQEAAPIEVALEETQVIPDLVIEGRVDDTLRRAQAEDKPALVRLGGSEEKVESLLKRWPGQGAQELLTNRFAVGQATEDEAARLRKPTDDSTATTLIVFNAQGQERDRLRDLYGEELVAALKANLAGKTYAATLMENLAAQGGQDRKLRLQLHEALRARGELTGAFNAILWLVENPRDDFEMQEMSQIGFRLERLVAADGGIKADLLKQYERAVEVLRRDATNVSAARALFVLTLGLQHDDAVWLEFPRLIPKENSLWWELSGNWLGRTVRQKRYRDVVRVMDVEKFFAAGPEWVRVQLAKRAASPSGQVYSVMDWQRRLVGLGYRAVEALAGARQDEAALRVARAVRRIDRTTWTRDALARNMRQAGAGSLADRFLKEQTHAP
jgi:hypothetical protein